MKKAVPILFALGFILIATSLAFLDKGWLKQSVLFLGVVSAIAGMIFRIALLVKKN